MFVEWMYEMNDTTSGGSLFSPIDSNEDSFFVKGGGGGW